MGSLTFRNAGSVYLDANGFIYSVERIEPYRTLLEPMWLSAQAGQFDIASSELTLLETPASHFRKATRRSRDCFVRSSTRSRAATS